MSKLRHHVSSLTIHLDCVSSACRATRNEVGDVVKGEHSLIRVRVEANHNVAIRIVNDIGVSDRAPSRVSREDGYLVTRGIVRNRVRLIDGALTCQADRNVARVDDQPRVRRSLLNNVSRVQVVVDFVPHGIGALFKRVLRVKH